MKRLILPSLVFFALASLTAPVVADVKKAPEKEKPKPTGKSKPTQPAKSRLIAFKPKKLGAPIKNRVTGGTRTVGNNTPEKIVLCTVTPKTSCLTLKESPSIYWYQSVDTKAGEISLALSLAQAQGPGKPVGGRHLIDRPLKKGIHRFDLRDEKVTLMPDQQYGWTVTLKSGRRGGSKNLVAGGRLIRVIADSSLTRALESVSEETEKYEILADHGIWYDVFDGIHRLVEQNPSRKDLIATYQYLTEQTRLGVEIRFGGVGGP